MHKVVFFFLLRTRHYSPPSASRIYDFDRRLPLINQGRSLLCYSAIHRERS